MSGNSPTERLVSDRCPSDQCLLFHSLAWVSVHRPHRQVRKFSTRGLVRYEILVLFPVPMFDPVHELHCVRLAAQTAASFPWHVDALPTVRDHHSEPRHTRGRKGSGKVVRRAATASQGFAVNWNRCRVPPDSEKIPVRTGASVFVVTTSTSFNAGHRTFASRL